MGGILAGEAALTNERATSLARASGDPTQNALAAIAQIIEILLIIGFFVRLAVDARHQK